VADVLLEHPSISRQHAVIQFRLINIEDPKTLKKSKLVKPYLMDLESANGTLLNGTKVPTTRYIELKNKDVLKFGFSTREFVLLNGVID
jgi:smad nuclear-interacting protein 1